MIGRSNTVAPRIRAGRPTESNDANPRSWIHERAPRLRNFVRERGRRERAWAWLSLVTLIVCWDASSRLEHWVSPPRVRIAHAVEREEAAEQTLAADL